MHQYMQRLMTLLQCIYRIPLVNTAYQQCYSTGILLKIPTVLVQSICSKTLKVFFVAVLLELNHSGIARYLGVDNKVQIGVAILGETKFSSTSSVNCFDVSVFAFSRSVIRQIQPRLSAKGKRSKFSCRVWLTSKLLPPFIFDLHIFLYGRSFLIVIVLLYL